MFKNIKIKDVLVPSQFFLAPINTGFSSNGLPDDRLIDFHKNRSGNGIGVSYVGNVAIDKEFITNENTLYLVNESDRLAWETLAKTVLNMGSVPGIQLGCRVSSIKPMRTSFINNYINEYVKKASEEFCSFSHMLIDSIIQKYIESAMIAYNLGFKVIQIHAAHGYFLSLSLSQAFNKRTDKYGDKIGILKLIIDGIRKKIPDAVLDVRVSLIEGIKGKDIELEEKCELISKIFEMDIDIISISNGIYNIDKYLIYPDSNAEHGLYENYGIKFSQQYPSKIWNIAGNIYDIQKLEGLQVPNLTYSIGRALIADPLFLRKTEMKDENNIVKCKKCNKCHYYSNSKKFLLGCLLTYKPTLNTKI